MTLNNLLAKYFDSDATELVSKSISFIVIRVLGTVFSFAFSYYVTQNFGADIYGLVSLGFTFFLIISVIGRLGLDINFVKYFSVSKSNKDSGLYFVSLLKSFFFTGLLSLIIFLCEDYLVNEVFDKPKPELIPYLNWILPAVPFWSVTILNANYLRARRQSNWYAFFNTSSRFLFTLVFLVVFISFSSNPIVIVKAHFWAIVSVAVFSFILSVVRFKEIHFRPKLNSLNFLKDSLPIMYSSSVIVILNWIGTFVLGIYSSAETVAIFDICTKISFLLNFVMQAVNSILAPQIAKKYTLGKIESCQKLIRFSAKVNFLSSLIIGVLVIAFNKFILGVFGDEFKSGTYIFILLCAGQLVSSYAGSVGVILQMIGKQKVYQYSTLAGLGVSVISMFFLVPLYGGLGAALSTLMSMCTWNFLSALYLKRKMNLISYFRL